MNRTSLSDEEIRLAQELCVEMGECAATYHIVLGLGEIARLRDDNKPLNGEINRLQQLMNTRDTKQLAQQITRRLIENAVRLQWTRHWDALEVDEITEEEMVQDALNLALGDDTGCLGDDEIDADHIDVLWVERELTKLISGECAVEA